MVLMACTDLCYMVVRRYCSGKKGKGKKSKFGVDYSGASHIAELHALLRATVMVSTTMIDCSRL